MSSASVNLGNGTRIELDAIQGDGKHITRGILLSLEGHDRSRGVINSVIIPAHQVRAVIASLELVAKQVTS